MLDAAALRAVNVVIFDMDGTLYQEDTFVDRYIRYLLEGTPHEAETEDAVREAREMLSGLHPVRFGHFYHKTDAAFFVRGREGFSSGRGWNGEPVDPKRLADASRREPEDDDALHYIGDPWGIVALFRWKYGVPESRLQEAFARVRKEMISEPHRFARHRRLYDAIAGLRGVAHRIVLMTNTYQASGLEFLEYMGIERLFDEIICDARKPRGIESFVAKLLEQGYEPREILSIGDNPWNDLAPVKRLGGRTCFASPYPSDDADGWDERARALDDLAALLERIVESKKAAAPIL